VSLAAKEGRAFGLLGRNGAGKTTSLRLIMDIFKPDSGEVLIDGKPLGLAKKRIGYMPEERGLYQKRVVVEQMAYIGMLRGLSKDKALKNAKRWLDELEAGDFAKRRLDTLSKGNQQKVQLAVALINDPDTLILDEPFSGLDPVNAKLLKDIVRRLSSEGRTIIFSSHQMSLVEEFCDEVCIIDKGETVLNGRLDEIKRSYPRNIYFASMEKPADEALLSDVAYAMGDALIRAHRKENGVEFELSSSSERGPLFNTLLRLGAAPEIFSVREPSLEQIFIEKTSGRTGDAV
jgi:ABC-2 type transport system ATP-binding protein